jgi:hypothetical protein
MSDEELRLWGRYDTAWSKLKAGKVGGSGGYEREYGIAYQALVKAGLALHLKKKYRG